MRLLFLFLLFFQALQLAAQNDPEFPKEFIMHLKLHNGMVTNFHSTAPDTYTGGIQVIPQYTFIPGLIRGGVILDGYYTAKKLQAAIGPTISIKLFTLKAKPFGSVGNLHLNLDHLWGSNGERLAGGGVNADVGNWIIIGITAHRDYHLNTWWIQSGIAVRISKVKRKKAEF